VRPEPLVGRAGDDVAAERHEVEPEVRGGVHRVDVHARARRVRRGDDALEVGDGPDRVRRRGDGDPARALGQHRLDGPRGELERARLRIGEAHGRAGALGGDDPRPHVGVVVEPRADDLVARRPLLRRGGGEAHGQRRHARPEDDAVGLGTEQRRDRDARRLDELVGLVGGGERAVAVGAVAGAHPLGHRVDRDVDHLRSRRSVQPRPAVAQAGEALAVHARSARARARSCS
jgi:hypothetical protein